MLRGAVEGKMPREGEGEGEGEKERDRDGLCMQLTSALCDAGWTRGFASLRSYFGQV
jgi:hypothetical protein